MHIIVVSYMRKNEFLNNTLIDIINAIRKIDNNAECILFTDSERHDITNDYNFEIINYPGTKYRRLMHLFTIKKGDYLCLSIDNDMNFDIDKLKNFINTSIVEKADIAWARITAQANKHFFSKLVSIDKLLSSNIIRPLLWKFKVGISIPGQCFLINPTKFRGNLYKIDTFLEDLALGIYVSENIKNIKIFMFKEVIGAEFPNEKFLGLCKQRKRWAKGYYDIVKYSKGESFYNKVIIHGLAYHFTWMVNWILALFLYNINILFSIIYLCMVSFIITFKSQKEFFLGIVYQFVFPIFHIVWFINFLKGEKNENNE